MRPLCWHALATVALAAACQDPGAAKPGPGASPAAASAAARACEPWGARGFRVTVKTVGARDDAFRELTFDDTAGIITAHDSDIFASGHESATPRAIRDSKTLASDEHAALTRRLLAICPDAEARERACAPGACTSVRVERPGAAKVSFDDAVSGRLIMAELESFFPALRARR